MRGFILACRLLRIHFYFGSDMSWLRIVGMAIMMVVVMVVGFTTHGCGFPMLVMSLF